MFPTTSETQQKQTNNDCRVHYAVSDTPHTPNVVATNTDNYIHRNTTNSVATMTTNPQRCVGG